MKRKHDSDLYVNKHSVFLIQYHIVLVTKYRNRILSGDIKEFIYTNIKETLEMKDCNLLEMNGEEDHIHLLVETPPELRPSELVQVLKIRSARLVRKEYPEEVNKFYWKNVFWADGYFISTVSERTTENIRNYIQNQKH